MVLGYIYNEKRRFHVYVSNRVQRIRTSTSPEQWHYVSSEHNPADDATRPIASTKLQDTIWFSGPAFLHHPKTETFPRNSFTLVDPDRDSEVRPQVTVLHTTVSNRFERFSDWSHLIRAVGKLIHIARSYKQGQNDTPQACKGWHCCKLPLSADTILRAQKLSYEQFNRKLLLTSRSASNGTNHFPRQARSEN